MTLEQRLEDRGGGDEEEQWGWQYCWEAAKTHVICLQLLLRQCLASENPSELKD